MWCSVKVLPSRWFDTLNTQPMSLGLCSYTLAQNVRFHIQTYSLHWQVCENPIWLPDFCIPTYIYRVCIFKAFVTNTFGIDSDVLHFKLQNRNDLKMKHRPPQKKKKKEKVFPFATKTLLLSSIITWTILTTHHGYLICCLKWAHRSLGKNQGIQLE